MSGLVAVGGGGGKDGCCNGEVSTGRPVGEPGVVEVGAVFLRVVKTAVKVEFALGKLTSNYGTCGGPTVVSSGSDVITVAVSPAEAVRALDYGKVAEEVAGRGGIGIVVGDKERVVDIEKAAVNVGVEVVEVVDGGSGVGEAGFVAVEAEFKRAREGVVRGGGVALGGGGGWGRGGGGQWGSRRGDRAGGRGRVGWGRVNTREAGAFSILNVHGGGGRSGVGGSGSGRARGMPGGGIGRGWRGCRCGRERKGPGV